MKTILLLISILLIVYNIQFVNAGSNLRTSFAPFQNLTNQFLMTVQPNDTALNISLNLIKSNAPMNSGYNYYINLYWQPYVGYIVLIIIGILFIVFFTLVGCCFCCCRVCCHKCGAKIKNVSSYNLKKKRIAFNILLFLFTTLIFIGAIVAMASNFILLETVAPMNTTSDENGNVFFNIDSSIKIINNYIGNVGKNLMGPGLSVINSLIKNAFSLFSSIVTLFIDTFKSVINFDSLKNSANTFITNYKTIQPICTNLSSISKLHQTQTDRFKTFLQDFKTKLNDSLTADNCQNITNSCDNVRKYLVNLTLGFNKSNINYVFDANSENITNQYNTTNLQSAIDEVTSTVTNITNDANKTFSDNINTFINNLNVTTLISNFNNTINAGVTTITNLTSQQIQTFFNMPFNGKSIAYGGIYDYFLYVFYGFCALISLILLVVLLFYVGLCFGICGAPNFENAAKCNRGTGGGFFMAAVAISFLFGFLIMLITMIMFLIGGFATTEGCRYVKSTNNDQIQIIDSTINHFLGNTPITIGPFQAPKINFYQSIKVGCSNSTDLISAFQIPSTFINNVTSYLFTNFIEGELNKTINTIGNYNVSKINTSPLDGNMTNITNIISQLVNGSSPADRNELSKPVILLDLQAFNTSLQDLYNDLIRQNKSNAIDKSISVSDLETNLTLLQNYHNQFLQVKINFDSTVPKLSESLTNLNNSLNTIKQQPINARNKAIKEVQSKLSDTTKNIINNTLYNIINVTGDCKGITAFFDSFVNTMCVVFLGPFNNLWMGMGWFLLFIIPAIIFAVKLNGIYRMSHVESESAAYNQAYMSSNQFLSKDNLEMIRLGRPQKA